jgi:PfaB family protein
LASLEASLLADPIAMLISGAALAILYTHILQDGFGIQPSAAFGYSLGENSMMFATGVWAQGDQAAARLEQSESFRVRLAGPQLAVREYWGLNAENGASQQPLWSNYLVMAAPEKVQAVLEHHQHVYLTHINTPRQVVIGGDPQACQRVLAELKGSALQAPFDYALHCEVMRSEYNALADLHDWPVEVIPPLQMYSAADYGPVTIHRQEIAEKIGHMLTTPLDFPRLINTVYENGARVFIEVGAGATARAGLMKP